MRPVHADAAHEQVKIGAKLRAARTTQHLTLEQVARASGLSRSFISRVENDTTSPSIATLVQLCQVLAISVGSLFAEPDVQLTRLETAPRINMGGTGTTERLLTARSEGRVQMIHTLADPGASGGSVLYTIACELEIVHVLRGSVTIEFTSHSTELRQGDTLSFPGLEPHTWHADDSETELVWTLIPAVWSGSP